jgi:uncharacterized protein (TIGR02001 family)
MINVRIRSGFAAGIAAGITAGMALFAAPAAKAQPASHALHGSVTLSSEYILNGLSQTDDEPSLRLSLDFEHQSGFFAGGLLANVDYVAEAQFQAPRNTAASVYSGFLWRRDRWMTNLTVSRYRYPGIERSYDYTQATINASFRNRFFLAVSRTGDYLSIYDNANLYRAGIALPWIRNTEFGVNAGEFRADGPFFDTAYTFWDIGLSRPIGRFAVDLRYHDNTYGFSSLLGNDADNLWILGMTYAFLPIAESDR